MYTILNMWFKLSRYIESYYRYDDILAVNNDTTVTLPISELFSWLDKLSNEVKRDYKGKVLPPSSTYQKSMDHIIYHLWAVAVNIDYNLLIPNSYQLEDYTLVFDTRQVDYKEDDGLDHDDPRINPINQNFLKMNVRHPYCTSGVYNMSSQELNESNLCCMSHRHTGADRFALTSAINLTTKNTMVTNDKEWLAAKASHSEFARLDAPASLKSKLPALLQKKNAPALPKVGRDADEGCSPTIRIRPKSGFIPNLRSHPDSTA